jgi:tRNA (cmo5U34)-methyltransferase
MIKEKFSTWHKSVPNYDEFQDTITECVTKDVENELKVLELGVGNGGTAITFLKKFPKSNYYGLDNSEESVKKCKDALKYTPNAKIEVSDFSEFESDEKFDIIIAALSIHHLEKEDKQKLINNIKNWLNKDGIFVWGDLVKLEDKEMNEKAIKVFKNFRERVWNDKEKQKVREHIQSDKHIFNTLEEMKTMLNSAGFRKIDLIWDYYRLVVIRAI